MMNVLLFLQNKSNPVGCQWTKNPKWLNAVTFFVLRIYWGFLCVYLYGTVHIDQHSYFENINCNMSGGKEKQGKRTEWKEVQKKKNQTAKEHIFITKWRQGEEGWQQDSKQNEGGGRELGGCEGGLWLRDERGVWEVKLQNPLGFLSFSLTHTHTHTQTAVVFDRIARADAHKDTLNGRKTEIKEKKQLSKRNESKGRK